MEFGGNLGIGSSPIWEMSGWGKYAHTVSVLTSPGAVVQS